MLQSICPGFFRYCRIVDFFHVDINGLKTGRIKTGCRENKNFYLHHIYNTRTLQGIRRALKKYQINIDLFPNGGRGVIVKEFTHGLTLQGGWVSVEQTPFPQQFEELETVFKAFLYEYI